MADGKQQGGAQGADAQKAEEARRAQQAQDDQRARERDAIMNRSPSDKTVATMGYDEKGEPRVFNLLRGEKLPEGWADAPPEGTHPNQPRR